MFPFIILPIGLNEGEEGGQRWRGWRLCYPISRVVGCFLAAMWMPAGCIWGLLNEKKIKCFPPQASELCVYMVLS